MTYDQGEPKSVKLLYKYDYGYQLHIDTNLARVFGFDHNSFDAGEFPSTLVPDMVLFQNISVDDVFVIDRSKWTSQKGEIQQLVDPTAMDILLGISTAAATLGHLIGVELDEEKSTATINTFTPHKYITVSEFLRS